MNKNIAIPALAIILLLSMTAFMPAFTARTVWVEDYWAYSKETAHGTAEIGRRIGYMSIWMGTINVNDYEGTLGEGI